MSNKNKVLALVKERTQSFEDSKEFTTFGITANEISELLGFQRSYSSHILNELNKEGKLIKVNTRPVYFIEREAFERKIEKKLTGDLIFDSFDALKIQALEKALNAPYRSTEVRQSPFSKFIGYEGSMKYHIEQCKAAINYPPNGIPILINGETGTGKSFLAQLMYEYALQKNIIPSGAPFMIFNCAEYANNPELLSANLFGYVKGAFTGANRDHKGILEEADGGFLFLDEIHRLPPEGQEKLFLFMDEGIFRRIGESSGWRKAKVRFIFATTEKLETFLLSTFLRRIPIVVSLPSLRERPLVEKLQLIHNFFKQEAQALNWDLHISKQTFRVLIKTDFRGNVGQLKNDIKFTCARAYNSSVQDNNFKGNLLPIKMTNLPEHLTSNFISKTAANDEYLAPIIEKDLIIKRDYDGEFDLISIFNQKQLGQFKAFLNSITEFSKHIKKNQDVLDTDLEKITVTIDKFFDEIILGITQYPKEDIRNLRFNTILKTVSDVFQTIKAKYGLQYYDNIGYKVAGFITQSFEHIFVLDIDEKNHKFKALIDTAARLFPGEYGAAKMIESALKSNLEIFLSPFEIYVLTLYLRGINRQRGIKRTRAVIIAHGFSTASSIANVANHLLGENIFESFDMPIDVKTEQIVERLRQYVKEVDTSQGIIILVDMGSLEGIYEGLQGVSQGVIGIVNNITTQLALDAGSSILQGFSPEQIIERITSNHKLRHKIIKPLFKKKKAIITTCITGIGTAIKIKDLIIKSLGQYSKQLEVIAADYLELKNKGLKSEFFSNYEVVMIIGTENPKIEGLPFFSLEEIISGSKEQEFAQLLKDFIPEQNVLHINQSFIKYFSLESVLNYITILNPNRIIEQVERAISIMQYELKVTFSNAIKISLYIHLSCLIERLITKAEIDNYEPETVKQFEECNRNFIEIFKKSFSVIENLYSVSIPITEIYFIYELLCARIDGFSALAK